MKFEEILPALREGKKVRRGCWHQDISSIENTNSFRVAMHDLIQQDWEIIEEPKKHEVKFWVNVYEYHSPEIFSSRKDADNFLDNTDAFMKDGNLMMRKACKEIEIEFEEGEGL